MKFLSTRNIKEKIVLSKVTLLNISILKYLINFYISYTIMT